MTLDINDITQHIKFTINQTFHLENNCEGPEVLLCETEAGRIVDEAVGEGAGPNAAAQTQARAHEDDGAPDHVKVDPLLQLRSHVA